jgi:CRISPR-associated protein Csb2
VLAVEITLLAERYTATSFNDRDHHEWPPHPGRLFSALVAAWAQEEQPSDDERAVLEWLEGQAPPAIAVASGRARSVVTHFVPVNDATSLAKDLSGAWQQVRFAEQELTRAREGADAGAIGKAERALARARDRAATDLARAVQLADNPSARVRDSALEVLPERRGRQPRTYPTVIPDEPVLWFVWPTAEPTEAQRSCLDGLLQRVGRLGHSSSFVSCRLVDDPPAPSLAPRGDGPDRLRVPRPGLLRALEASFLRHGGTEPRQLPAPIARYGPVSERPQPPAPLLGGDWIVLPIEDRYARPAITRTVDVARAVRAALMRHGPQPAPEIISGHVARANVDGPTEPLSRPHLAVVPLPAVIGPHPTGVVFGVAVVLPSDVADEERRVVEAAVVAWGDANGRQLVLPGQGGRSLVIRLGEPVVVPAAGMLELAPSLPATLDRRRWCRTSATWVSVTPVALDRYPRDLRSTDPARREEAERDAEVTLARACVHAGLPEPVVTTVRFDPPLPGSAPVGGWAKQPGRRFPPYRAGSSGTVRPCVHAHLTFPEPVAGPVLIGAGRYHGYGLFLPR